MCKAVREAETAREEAAHERAMEAQREAQRHAQEERERERKHELELEMARAKQNIPDNPSNPGAEMLHEHYPHVKGRTAPLLRDVYIPDGPSGPACESNDLVEVDGVTPGVTESRTRGTSKSTEEFHHRPRYRLLSGRTDDSDGKHPSVTVASVYTTAVGSADTGKGAIELTLHASPPLRGLQRPVLGLTCPERNSRRSSMGARESAALLLLCVRSVNRKVYTTSSCI
ncbi:hypothetical protein UY3_17220 [Chelonia mydas]|uniref:Uncharacterized protein n=1 Tax=Chelonia mydas TaxID=8469 RepID=M7AMG8_CHEMY|nr:hypothetical protein UY3_17220 [Chelonia mydas]